MNDNVDINYIKKMFCSYKCNAKNSTVDVNVSDSFWCEECQEYKDTCVDTTTELNDEETCKLCQIDNFLRELQDNNINLRKDNI